MSWYQEKRRVDEWEEEQRKLHSRIIEKMAGRMFPGRDAVVEIMRKKYSKYGKNKDIRRILSYLRLSKAERDEAEEEAERMEG